MNSEQLKLAFKDVLSRVHDQKEEYKGICQIINKHEYFDQRDRWELMDHMSVYDVPIFQKIRFRKVYLRTHARGDLWWKLNEDGNRARIKYLKYIIKDL